MTRTRWIGRSCFSLLLAALIVAGLTGASRKSRHASDRTRAHPGLSTRALLVQVLLDRAGFSVGEIDGTMGSKTQNALRAFQRAKHLPETGVVDPDTTAALTGTAMTSQSPSPTTTYRVTAEDVAGPFVKEIPPDLEHQGELEMLSYASPLELIAERFHASPHVLQRLNRRARFVEGETIVVPDVTPTMYPTVSERRKPEKQAAAGTGAVIVSKARNDLRVEGVNGEVLFYAPVSSGSEHDPLPIGEWRVTDVYLLPVFHYNPELFWDAEPSHAKTRIAPGPNNPAGVAWIDIDREHYGLHGTPEPSKVGVTQSHGCVRLTNWDVIRLAALVQPGTRVVFEP
jgi:lipoprotein-anchoring transpeptidase ErfK/SrfK